MSELSYTGVAVGTKQATHHRFGAFGHMVYNESPQGSAASAVACLVRSADGANTALLSKPTVEVVFCDPIAPFDYRCVANRFVGVGRVALMLFPVARSLAPVGNPLLLASLTGSPAAVSTALVGVELIERLRLLAPCAGLHSPPSSEGSGLLL